MVIAEPEILLRPFENAFDKDFHTVDVKTKNFDFMIFDGLMQTQISQPTGTLNGRDYVDLGLSVMWARYNVGARTPFEGGDYFAWGETKPKSVYKESNSFMFQREIENIVGDPQYDTARANWGGTWRLPTREELYELDKYCKKKWTSYGGCNGYKVTGPNGSSIFFPAAGIRDDASLDEKGSKGFYWGESGFVMTDYSFKGYNLLSGCRYLGHSVRPVATPCFEIDSRQYTGQINGHKYVDLGLNVKWATCNVGAVVPYDCGDYFAWGETKPKSSYTPANCATEYTKIDNIAGNPQYDAARANWGGNWRVPTMWDLDNLVSKCKRERMTCRGREGYKITGPNGNYIFLPASGRWCDNSIVAKLSSHCWSDRSAGYEKYMGEYREGRAYFIRFDADSSNYSRIDFFYIGDGMSRYVGMPIRPVID